MEPLKHDITDEAHLLRQIRRGSSSSMKALYAANVRYLAAICSRYISNQEDVKDVLQDSFLKIFDGIRNFEYRGEGSLKAWAARITLNETLAFLKHSDKLKFIDNEATISDIPDDEPDALAIPTETIHSLIRSLPDGYRTIFNLYVIEGKSHKEIAAMLGIKENSSASQFHRAKALLAEKIREYQNNNTSNL